MTKTINESRIDEAKKIAIDLGYEIDRVFQIVGGEVTVLRKRVNDLCELYLQLHSDGMVFFDVSLKRDFLVDEIDLEGIKQAIYQAKNDLEAIE